MKKFTVMSLAALLILAFGATAYAAEEIKLEFRASGSIDAQTHYSVNVPPLNPLGQPIYGVGGTAAPYTRKQLPNFASQGLDKKISYWDSRMVLRFDAVMGKELSGTLQFEIDAGRWGNAPTGVLGNMRDAGNVGYWSTDRTAIEIKYMYFDAALPYFGIPVPMTVRLGAQPLAIRPWFFQATDGMGISAGLKIDPVNINPFYFKPAEGVDWSADDTDIYGLQVNAKVGTFTIGGYGLYYHAGSYPMWVASSFNTGGFNTIYNAAFNSIYPQLSGTQKASFWWVGFYADGKAGPVNLQLDAGYDRGTVQASAPGIRKVEYEGWATRIKIDYPFEKFNFGATGMYASGSDVRKTSSTGLAGTTSPGTQNFSHRVQGWMVPTGSENGAANGESVVIYGMEAGASGGQGWAVNHNYNQVTKGALGGTWFAKLYGSYMVAPWYKVTIQGLYIGDTTKHGNTFGNARRSDGALRDEDTIGVELDLMNEIAIYKNLSFKVFGGYMFAGDAMNFDLGAGNDRNANIRNPWAIRTRLMYSF
jgi:hypothetical protein